MADWTNPPWAQLVAGKAWTDEKAAAAFENPIAMFEGALDAPRLNLGALPRLTAGNEIRSRIDTEQSGFNTGASVFATIDAFSFGIMQAGQVRISFTHRASPAGGTARVIRIRGGVSVTVASYANTTSNTSDTVDVPVLPGDLLKVEAGSAVSPGGGGSVQVYISNIRLSTGGEDLWPGIPAPLEGMTYA